MAPACCDINSSFAIVDYDLVVNGGLFTTFENAFDEDVLDINI